MKTDAPQTPIESLPAEWQQEIKRIRQKMSHYRLEAKRWKGLFESQQQTKPTK